MPPLKRDAASGVLIAKPDVCPATKAPMLPVPRKGLPNPPGKRAQEVRVVPVKRAEEVRVVPVKRAQEVRVVPVKRAQEERVVPVKRARAWAAVHVLGEPPLHGSSRRTGGSEVLQ